MKKFYTWYQKHITGAIFIGLILGILTGLFLAGRFEPVLTITSLLGSIYMNALNMMIFPLVFCSIIMGITKYQKSKCPYHTGRDHRIAAIFFHSVATGLASRRQD
ncbi:MAG: cation:dicarboxylate symporter family transporter [Oliverpabstia sp.]